MQIKNRTVLLLKKIHKFHKFCSTAKRFYKRHCSYFAWKDILHFSSVRSAWNKIAENPNLLYEICNIVSVANKSFCQCITLEAILFSANFLLHIAERMYAMFSILSILNISLQASYHLPPLIRGIIRHLWVKLGTARLGISSAFSREQPSGTVGITWRGGVVIFIQFSSRGNFHPSIRLFILGVNSVTLDRRLRFNRFLFYQDLLCESHTAQSHWWLIKYDCLIPLLKCRFGCSL